MKLIVFLLGIAVGAFGYRYYYATPAPTNPGASSTGAAQSSAPTTETRSFVDRASQGAAAARDSIAQEFADWNLTPETIKKELDETGRVVRSKTDEAGRALSNARVIAVIEAKYTLDRDLSARAIEVEAVNGKVTLRGSAASPGLVARAISLALETDGVTSVESQLSVTP